MHDQAFVTLYVKDMERSKTFYRDIVKWELVGESKDWTEFKTGSGAIVLRPGSVEDSSRGACRVSLWVDDVDSALRDLSAQSVIFVQSPKASSLGKQATFCDPEGNRIDLVERQRSTEDASVSDTTVVNDILTTSPEAMEVLEEHGIRICGGCIVLLNGSVRETAEYSGLGPKETLRLVEELNKKVKGKGDA